MNQQQLEQIKQAAEEKYPAPDPEDFRYETAFAMEADRNRKLVQGFIAGASWMQGEGERLREQRDYLDEIAHHENREVVRLKNEVVAMRTALAFIADHAESMTKENIAGHAKMMLLCIPDPKPQSK